MNVDELLDGVEVSGSQPKILAAVRRHLAVKPCRYGSLLNSLHDLDLAIMAESEGLHRQALLSNHQMAEWNVSALVKEGNTGCKQCACCLQFAYHHNCDLSQLSHTGVYDDEY